MQSSKAGLREKRLEYNKQYYERNRDDLRQRAIARYHRNSDLFHEHPGLGRLDRPTVASMPAQSDARKKLTVVGKHKASIVEQRRIEIIAVKPSTRNTTYAIPFHHKQCTNSNKLEVPAMVRPSKLSARAADRAPPPAAAVSRRIDPDLMMECVEEELTPSQAAATERAAVEYEAAVQQIELARQKIVDAVAAAQKEAEEKAEAEMAAAKEAAATSAAQSEASGAVFNGNGVGEGYSPFDNFSSRTSASSPDVIVLDDEDCVMTYPTLTDSKSTPVSAPRPRGRPRRNTAANQPQAAIASPAPEAFYSTPVVSRRGRRPSNTAYSSIAPRPEPSSNQMFVVMGGEGVSQRIILPAGYTATAGGQILGSSMTLGGSGDMSEPMDTWSAISQVMGSPPPAAISPGGSRRKTEIIPGTYGLGVKRVGGGEGDEGGDSKRGRKKSAADEAAEAAAAKTLIPLDEFYYGKIEGDPSYREEKKEYKFKCSFCQRVLYNNIRLMQHMQEHFDSEVAGLLDGVPDPWARGAIAGAGEEDWEGYIDRYGADAAALVCRICEKPHATRSLLTAHMKQLHKACEMPYVCQLCNYRSSIFGDVIEHFKKRHDSSSHLLCLYCLKTMHTPFMKKADLGQTTYYCAHLQKHMRKSSKKCTCCRLTFVGKVEAHAHYMKDHTANCKGIIGKSSIGAPLGTTSAEPVMIEVEPGSKVKLLNAPRAGKQTDLRAMRVVHVGALRTCIECTKPMNAAQHYRYIQCALCRYATACGDAYSSHMTEMHAGKGAVHQLHAAKTPPAPRRVGSRAETKLEKPTFCLCGFSSFYGSVIAVHLVACSKRTCYAEQPETKFIEYDEEQEEEDLEPDEEEDESSLVIPASIIVEGIIDDLLDDLFPAERAVADCLSALLERVELARRAEERAIAMRAVGGRKAAAKRRAVAAAKAREEAAKLREEEEEKEREEARIRMEEEAKIRAEEEERALKEAEEAKIRAEEEAKARKEREVSRGSEARGEDKWAAVRMDKGQRPSKGAIFGEDDDDATDEEVCGSKVIEDIMTKSLADLDSPPPSSETTDKPLNGEGNASNDATETSGTETGTGKGNEVNEENTREEVEKQTEDATKTVPGMTEGRDETPMEVENLEEGMNQKERSETGSVQVEQKMGALNKESEKTDDDGTGGAAEIEGGAAEIEEFVEKVASTDFIDDDAATTDKTAKSSIVAADYGASSDDEENAGHDTQPEGDAQVKDIADDEGGTQEQKREKEPEEADMSNVEKPEDVEENSEMGDDLVGVAVEDGGGELENAAVVAADGRSDANAGGNVSGSFQKKSSESFSTVGSGGDVCGGPGKEGGSEELGDGGDGAAKQVTEDRSERSESRTSDRDQGSSRDSGTRPSSSDYDRGRKASDYDRGERGGRDEERRRGGGGGEADRRERYESSSARSREDDRYKDDRHRDDRHRDDRHRDDRHRDDRYRDDRHRDDRHRDDRHRDDRYRDEDRGSRDDRRKDDRHRDNRDRDRERDRDRGGRY